MTTLSAYCNSCPEAVSEVNVTSAAIEIDGEEAVFRAEQFSFSDVVLEGTSYYVELDYYPVSTSEVTVYRNGTVLRPTTDYRINGNLVIFTFAVNAEDAFLVKYLGYTTEVAATDVGATVHVGLLGPYNGSVVPPGWCLADGVTAYVKADYLALYTYCSGGSLVVPGSDAGDEFIIKELKYIFNSGGVLVELPAIIKA
jgi:hypothetical protein